jgi:6-phosphogluconolactonase
MNARILTAIPAIVLVLWAGSSSAAEKSSPGAVYTMTNDPSDNHVVIFDRDSKGVLTEAGTVSTGGKGSGGTALDALGSQGSLALSRDKRWLLAVNAGSNDISVFRVVPNGLGLVGRAGSGGVFPVSLTTFHDLVYVLNAGASPDITGFNLSQTGQLTALANSRRPLSGGFAQVGFDPKGETLVVTGKADSKILVFPVGKDGLPGPNPVVSASNGPTPFGFVFDPQGHLFVTEAGSGAVSSYEIRSDGTLNVISGSVTSGQKLTCWIDENGRFAFASNPGSGTISVYRIDPGKGELSLMTGAAGSGNGNLDLSAADNGRFLYVLNAGNGTIGMFQIGSDGTLTSLGTVAGKLSIFAQGLAAR